MSGSCSRAGLRCELLEPYPRPGSSPTGAGNRLWRAEASGPRCLSQHLLRHGRPIAYGYLARRYPLADYQTVFASRPGSAEMPSAARPFTPELVTTGWSRPASASRRSPCTPGSRRRTPGRRRSRSGSRCPRSTARLVNATRAEGGRVIAVGTTVTRALESAVGGGRPARRRLGLDRAGHLTAGPRAGGRRADHRLAQPGGLPPAAGGVGRRGRPDPARLRRGALERDTSGTSSATRPSCCRDGPGLPSRA